MREEANTRTVQELFAAFGRGDLEAILERLAEDVEWLVPGSAAIPYAGERHGRAEVAQFFMERNATVALEQFAPKQFIAQGEHVVVLGEELGRVRANDRVFHSEWAMVFTLRAGRIERMQAFEDTEAVAKAFRGG